MTFLLGGAAESWITRARACSGASVTHENQCSHEEANLTNPTAISRKLETQWHALHDHFTPSGAVRAVRRGVDCADFDTRLDKERLRMIRQGAGPHLIPLPGSSRLGPAMVCWAVHNPVPPPFDLGQIGLGFEPILTCYPLSRPCSQTSLTRAHGPEGFRRAVHLAQEQTRGGLRD